MLRKLKQEKPVEPTFNPEVEELQDKLSEAEAELAGFRSVQDITELEIRELKKQLAEGAGASNLDLTFLQEQVAAKDREIATLKAAQAPSFDVENLKMKAGQSEYLMSQLETARATISKLENEMLNQPAVNVAAAEQAFQRVRELEVELTQLHQDFDRSEDLKRASALALASAKQEIYTLQAGLTERQNDAVIVDTLKADLEELSSKLAGREQVISELRKENATSAARIAASQGELDDLKNLRTTFEIENQKLRDEVSNLKFELSESSTLRAKLAHLQDELSDLEILKSAKHQLQDRVAILETELEKAQASAQEADSLRYRIQQLEQDASHGRDAKEDLDYVQALLSQALARLNSAGTEASGDLPSFLAPLPRSA